jgi:DNA (cytosine-5)-methyltransferase 1
MKQLNAISLFSGAMGLDLGVERAGFNIRVCCEMNKVACQTIRKNSNIPVIERDITLVPTEEILNVANLTAEEVDLVVGGPPCQAFSSAGRQRGLADLRGNVIIQYLRVIEDIKPGFFILENVRGLLSAKLNIVPPRFEKYANLVEENGSVLFYLSERFKELGYTISFALFNSANYGVPQVRERMIIFGHKGTERIPLPAPTHSIDGANGTAKWVTLKDAIGDLEQPKETDFLPLREKNKEVMKLIKEGENWTSLPGEIAKKAMGKAYELGGGKTGFLRRLSYSKPSPTLVTCPTMPATLLCHPTELRPLSIKEYARIQQFPDSWDFQGKIIDIYKQIGNAVPVGLGYMAAKNIINFINGNRNEIHNGVPYSRYNGTTDSEFFANFQSKINVQPSLFD